MGTSFALDLADRQYLITASHLLDDMASGSSVEIYHADQWTALPTQFVGATSEDLDVTVLAPTVKLCPPGFPVEPTLGGVMLGQDVHFLGFPFGWRGPSTDLMRQAPLPFVKRATLSMIDFENDLIFLDGINNEGFSGAPVLFKPHDKTDVWHIAGVVTGYHDVAGFVSANDEETALTYYSNSGLIYVTPIKRVVELIEANAIGVALN